MATFLSLSYVCPIRWSEMRGDEKARFCSKCSRTVVNVSLLTEAQRVALLNGASSNQLCVAYYRRLSGEFVSAENPLTASECRSLARYGAAALAVGGALAMGINFDAAPNEALIRARDEITTVYHSVKSEVESNTQEIVESLTAPFLRKNEPPVMMTLGMVVCPPPVSSSGSIPSATPPLELVERTE
jgi:hypothetical protein